MISKFFSYNNSLDDIYKFDMLSNGSENQYWHLNVKDYYPYSWEDCVFTDSEIRSIIFMGKKIDKNRGTTGKDDFYTENTSKIRRSFVSWIPSNSNTSWIYRRLTDLVLKHNENYFDLELTKIETLQFTHYYGNEKGCYRQHVDFIPTEILENRKLSFVLQLSDPSEYEGGDLILNPAGTPVTVEKNFGKIIFFPSHTLHEVTPVTKGTRYTLVGWVHGPKLR